MFFLQLKIGFGIALKKADAEDSKDGKWRSSVYGEWSNGLRRYSRGGKTVSVGSEWLSHGLGLKDITLANEDAVNFLERCEAGSVTLKNCPA